MKENNWLETPPEKSKDKFESLFDYEIQEPTNYDIMKDLKEPFKDITKPNDFEMKRDQISFSYNIKF